MNRNRCSKPTSRMVRPPTGTARRGMWGMPEGCSRTRIRSAAPKAGAPLAHCAPFRRRHERDERLRRDGLKRAPSQIDPCRPSCKVMTS